MHTILNGNGREHRYRVLLVDTDVLGVEEVTSLLRADGFTVTQARSFEEGKRLLAAEPPHVLIADVRLGQFNGLQLLMRARAENYRLAAMITCAFADTVLEQETRRFGGTFFVKPVRAEHVVSAIKHSLATEGVVPSAVERRQQPPAGRRVLTNPTFRPERRVSDRRQAGQDEVSEERRVEERRKALMSGYFPDRRGTERRALRA